MLFHSQIGTPFAHPTVMWRRALFQRMGLEYCDVVAQDFDLWVRAFAKGARGANLAEALVLYRIHAQSDTSLRRDESLRSANIIARRQIQSLTGQAADEEFCLPRFRAVVHAAFTGNPIELSSNDRIHLAHAAELLRRGRASSSFAVHEQYSLEVLITGAYERCGGGPSFVPVAPEMTTGDSGPAAEARTPGNSVYGSVLDHLRSTSSSEYTVTSTTDGLPRIPVFVPCFNNPTYLSAMVGQLIGCGFDKIVIIDNGSTFPPLLSYFRELPNSISLIRLSENRGPRHLFQDPDNYILLPNYFCLTDPDLQFNPALPKGFFGGVDRCQ